MKEKIYLLVPALLTYENKKERTALIKEFKEYKMCGDLLSTEGDLVTYSQIKVIPRIRTKLVKDNDLHWPQKDFKQECIGEQFDKQ